MGGIEDNARKQACVDGRVKEAWMHRNGGIGEWGNGGAA
jgi:hypothetical protein